MEKGRLEGDAEKKGIGERAAIVGADVSSVAGRSAFDGPAQEACQSDYCASWRSSALT
jgi:hypothetical protein